MWVNYLLINSALLFHLNNAHVSMNVIHPQFINSSLTINTQTNVWTHCRHCKKKRKRGRDGHTNKKKSYTVIFISTIIFITITIITITVLPPHMDPIPRIISSLSVAPGGCVIVCWCAAAPAAVGTVTPVDSQPDVFFFSPLILGQRLCQVHRGNRGMVL